jgi:hypothetical protein
MAKPEFSETQFVFGYLNEMYYRHGGHSRFFPFWKYFMFPSTLIEREFPVDFFADFYTHSEYYQFKRSDHFERRRGRIEIHAGVPTSYLDYYRFKIYNRTTATHLGQFEKLVALANYFPNDLVCYCAPCFHTEFEFHNHFRNRTIISNSVIIDCNQFNHPIFNMPNFNINDGIDHYMVYKLGSSFGYLCSEPKDIKIENAKSREEFIKNQKGEKSLFATINSLYEEFYLRDELKAETQKQFTDNIGERFYAVGSYLLQYYNIVWQPIFRKI